MSKFELSLSKDYVPSWTIVDAIRELFQNAIDQETSVENNEMFFDYNRETKTLRIGNEASVLSTSSLLLGSTSKSGDDSTIGQFGEGYKVATLVLLREGKDIVFWNYGAKEVWRPRFVNSRRYGAEILTFFVDKKHVWQTVPDNNLTIEITGITEEEYEEIQASNLHLSKPKDMFLTEYGNILLEDEYRGKVFVKGLYVCDYAPYRYGYDFNPQHIKLDRDRKLISDFELAWLASKMWVNSVSDEMSALATDLVMSGAADVKFVGDVYRSNQELSNNVLVKFKEVNGMNAVPVSSTKELETIGKEHKAIIVSDSLQKVIKSSPAYREPELITPVSYASRLREWFNEFGIDIGSGDARIQLEQLLVDMEADE